MTHREQRISLTYRSIATFIDAQGVITGQGARKVQPGSAERGCQGEAGGGGDGDAPVSQYDQLLSAFGDENRSSKFDWEKSYGDGFDIINFKLV